MHKPRSCNKCTFDGMNFLIVGLNISKCHTHGHCQAIWDMAGQPSSAVGISQFCYRIVIIERSKQIAKC